MFEEQISQPPVTNPLPATPAPQSSTPHKGLKKIFVIIAIVVFLVVIVALGYFLYKRIVQPEVVAPTADQPAVSVNGAVPTNGQPNSVNSARTNIDTDGDGLTDEEEFLLGTSIYLVDTDGDGLSDFDEVRIYFTDPLNPDTDGDGFTDGEEVRNGYNPNGPGLLLNFELEREKALNNNQ